MTSSIKISLINTFIFLIVALPILNAYGFFGGLSIGMILIAITILLILIRNGEYRLVFSKYYRIFFIYICIVSVIISIFTHYFDLQGVLRTSIKVFGFIITFGIASKYLDKNKAIYYYKRIAFFAILFFFIQEILYFMTGYRVSGMIPFLPLMNENLDMQSLIMKQTVSLRSASFFVEPSYLALYIIPYLIINIWEKNNRYRIYKITIIIIALFLLQSGVGMLLLISVIFISAILLIKNIANSKKVLLITALIIIIPMSFNLVLLTDSGKQLYKRTIEINPDSENITSGFIRVFRGYYVYNELSPLNKVVGVGQGNLRKLIEHKSSIKIKNLFFNEIYVNMFQQILITSGIIGVILFLFAHFKFYMSCNNMGKSLLFAFFVLMFMDAIYCTPIMLLYLVLAFVNIEPTSKKSQPVFADIPMLS